MSSLLNENCSTLNSNCDPPSCEEEIHQEIEASVYDTIHKLVEKTLGPNGLTVEDKLFWENEDMDSSMKLAISTITNCLTKYKHKGQPSTFSEKIKSISNKDHLILDKSLNNTTVYTLIRREFNMYDPLEDGRTHETIHYSYQELMNEIQDSGRLDWWFELYTKDDPDELEKEQAKEFGISWENPYEIFDKPFPLFWKFYETVIGKNTVHYEIIEEKHETQKTNHHKTSQTEFTISPKEFQNMKYLNDSKTTFINDCGITIIYCSNHPCTNHIYVDDQYLFSNPNLSLLKPSSYLENRSSYESWTIPDNISLESIQSNLELICPDCNILQ
jgi:hypothetical protein